MYPSSCMYSAIKEAGRSILGCAYDYITYGSKTLGSYSIVWFLDQRCVRVSAASSNLSICLLNITAVFTIH